MPPTWTKGGTETEKSDKGGGRRVSAGSWGGGVGASVGGSSGERKREEKRWK